ncbi:S9 family peptidase [Permianibacter sp. IMCC34836]|uniref:S9 family peptidase n=1 Tax=Permianibacter fluminis TaxID=2738515 RepID=UPI0015524371|nr:S9 family peptidase [Permianibacter fluminis]NQD36362.1 S9 family peptidase [Permianibacter fluminis]
MKFAANPAWATVLLGIACVATAAEKPALELSDMARLQDVSSPVFAPDNERIAYVVSTANTDSDASVSDLWLVSYRGGAPRQLTQTPFASEWSPRWSPDGKWLAFLSDRGDDESTQLWLLPADGGEARQLSSLKAGIEDFDWAPDGKRIVLVAEDPAPEQGKDSRGKDKPEPPRVITRYQFKEDGRDYLTDRYQHLYLLNVADGSAEQITTGSQDDMLPAWSPDGKQIAFVSRRVAGTAGDAERTLNFDVYTVAPAVGSEARRISAFNGTDVDPYWESRPEWSPDSRKLVWLQSGEDKWIYYAPWQLTVADLVSGKITTPARIDRCFYKPRWSADGKSIYALVEQSRNTWLAQIDPNESNPANAIRYVSDGNRFGYDYALSKNGRIALLDSDDRTPFELTALEPGAKQPGRALTAHNQFLTERKLQPAEDISFTSDGQRIDGFLMKPVGYEPGKRYPTILRIHGGPVYQFSHEFMFDWQFYAAKGFAVVAVNPRGSSGRGFDFAKAIYADWGNVDVKDVLAGVDHVVKLGVADPDRLGVGGWSYGSILTNYVIASDKRFKAAVSGAGTSNMLGNYGHDQYVREYELELGRPWENFDAYARVSFPFLHADRISTPTLFQCAEKDFNVPCLGAEQMYQALRSLRVPTQLVIFPGENHGLTVPSYLQDRLQRNLEWYERFLKTP